MAMSSEVHRLFLKHLEFNVTTRQLAEALTNEGHGTGLTYIRIVRKGSHFPGKTCNAFVTYELESQVRDAVAALGASTLGGACKYPCEADVAYPRNNTDSYHIKETSSTSEAVPRAPPVSLSREGLQPRPSSSFPPTPPPPLVPEASQEWSQDWSDWWWDGAQHWWWDDPGPQWTAQQWLHPGTPSGPPQPSQQWLPHGAPSGPPPQLYPGTPLGPPHMVQGFWEPPMQRMPVHAAVAPTCAKAGVPGATSKATSPATNEPDSPPWRKPCEGDGYELECEAEPTSPADHDQELQSMLWDALGPKVEDMVSDDKEAEPGQMAELKVKVEQEESEQDLEEEDEDHAGRARQKQKKRSRRSSRKGSKKKHKKHRKRSRSRRRRRSSSSSSISRSRSRRRRKH